MQPIHHIIFTPVTLIILLVLLAISFLLSASETSIIGLSKIRLRHMISRGIKRALHIQLLVSKMDKFIIAILVGNNFANIAISAIITGIFVYAFGYKWGVLIATIITAFFIVIFCEIIPKILAIKHTEKTALFIAPIMNVFIRLMRPVTAIFDFISNFLIKFMRIETQKRSPLITEEELRLMIELGREEGFVSDEEGKMLHRIFEFGNTRIKDVMVPKEKMAAVNIESTPEQLLNIFVEEGHARLPVYKGSIDNIIGVIHARDLLYILRDKGLFLVPDLLRDVYFVPANTRVNEVLRKFQIDKIQITIVIDQNKKTLGMVTLEDLTEEIVGEIEEKKTNIIRKRN